MSSNQFDQKILKLVNNERTNAGLDPLSIDSQLDQAANLHTDKMVQADKMKHQLPGEASLGDRVSATGYDWTRVAENIAAGYTTPKAVVNGWMNSSGHRANILNPNYTHLGVGYENAPDDNDSYNDYDVYWTQVFGTGNGNSDNQSKTEQPKTASENDNSDNQSEMKQPKTASENDNSDNDPEFVLGSETNTNTGDENPDLETAENIRGDNFDQKILQLVNNERTNAGLDPLSINSQLDQAANLHTDEMVQADKMEHRLPGEASLGDRVSATGYDWTRVAENIAAGYTTPEAVVNGWMNSSGHRANILNPNYTHLGVGYENAPDDNDSYNDYDVYWTQVFGTESSQI